MPRILAGARIAAVSSLLLSFAWAGFVADAQASSRSTFPGRRVGGGTRGECTSRTLAHLVPTQSVYSPGNSQTLGLLVGPTKAPVSLTLLFKPESNAKGGLSSRQTLPPTHAGVILVNVIPIKGPTIWESNFNCDSDTGSASSDPLAFVKSSSPPALSLLLPESSSEDQDVQSLLRRLRQRCGFTVPTVETLTQFELSDLITDSWPSELTVHCPS